MRNLDTTILPREILLLLFISALFVPSVMAEIKHTDEDARLVAGQGVITLDEKDPQTVLNNNKDLIPQNLSGNVVYITGAPAGVNTVYSGYCFSNTDCTAENNTLIMDDGAAQTVTGADATANASANTNVNTSASASGTVNLYGGTVTGEVRGAYAKAYASDSAIANAGASGTVNLYGGKVGGSVFGASANADANADASGTVNLFGASVDRGVTGATAYTRSYASANASANSNATGTVNLYGGTVKEDVRGAYAFSYASTNDTANATGTVNLYGGTMSGNINGAYVTANTSANAKGIVNLFGGTVGRNIYGANANANSGTATAHGTVTIADGAKLQSEDANGMITYASGIWGGYLNGKTAYYDVFSANTLNMRSAPLTVTTLGNFEYYNFAINDYNNGVINNAGSALITVTTLLLNNDTVSKNDDGTSTTTINKSRARLTGVSGKKTVNAGDTINLISLASRAKVTQGENNTSLNDFFDLTDSGNAINVGLVKTAEVSYSITHNAVVATIGKTTNTGASVSEDRVKRNVTPLAEGRLAALQNVTRGADSLERVISAPDVDTGSFTPVAILDGGTTRYNSGSHIDSRDYRFMVGTRYQATERLSGGLVMEYGRSSFVTHNGVDSGDIRGDGRTYNFGPALLGRYSLPVGSDRFYGEASLRAGRTSTEYGSGDIVTGGGTAVYYKNRSNYVGGSTGAGYVYTLNERYGLDTSVRYLYTILDSDGVVIDGDRVNFASSTSSRAQLKEQMNYRATKQITATLAGIYEYEFAGDAKANAYGVGINAPSVKGATGTMELGLNTRPVESHPDLGLDLSFRGYTGQREGVSGSVRVRYDF
ncbi:MULTISPECIES: hypothetical protein [Erwinia]|uniref:hypothetical protein n=1 Tax=Erwinia TaxID=551 RepID=UPI00148881D1|nr:hypothetical protein [Erwinia sp. JH02]NNS06681.1 hypothetical protein [Erwinia sp. JH02]